MAPFVRIQGIGGDMRALGVRTRHGRLGRLALEFLQVPSLHYVMAYGHTRHIVRTYSSCSYRNYVRHMYGLCAVYHVD
jgi:hypothetical protein